MIRNGMKMKKDDLVENKWGAGLNYVVRGL